MNQTEVLALLRFIAAASPAQKLDEYTADAWSEILADIDPTDAKTAVIKLVRSQPFISCCDIVAGVKEIRTDRLKAFGDIGRAPDEILSDRDNPRAWIEWENERREAIMSGALTRENDPHKELAPTPGYGTAGGAWWEN